jgi:hypothetical protein
MRSIVKPMLVVLLAGCAAGTPQQVLSKEP